MNYIFSTGDSVNTDRLPDVDALLLEKAIELYELVKQFNRGVIISLDVKPVENNPRRGVYFAKHADEESYQVLYKTLQAAVELHSQGKIAVLPSYD